MDVLPESLPTLLSEKPLVGIVLVLLVTVAFLGRKVIQQGEQRIKDYKEGSKTANTNADVLEKLLPLLIEIRELLKDKSRD